MSDSKNYITFILISSGTEHRLQTFWGEYRNLKDLIADKLFLEGFGECGGMGRCATCLVEIDGLEGEASTMKRNEATTLSKTNNVNLKTRLACQVAVDDSLSNVTIRV